MALRAWGTSTHANTKALLLSTLDGAATAANARMRHAATSQTEQIVYVASGWFSQTTAHDRTVNINAGIEKDATVTPVNLAEPAPLGELLESSPILVPFERGDEFYSRTHASATDGHVPMNRVTASVRGEGADHSSTDKSQSGTITASDAFGPGPAFLASEQTGYEPYKAVLIGGDSRADGQNASHEVDSYLVQALDADLVPYIHAACSGTTMQGVAAAPTHFQQLAAYCDACIAGWSINDLRNGRTAAQIRADQETFAAAIGIPVYLITASPDNSTGGLPTFEAERLALNALIRAEDGTGLFAGYFEVADLVETARNSGTFKPDYSDDGLHFASAEVHTIVSAAIDTSVFANDAVPPAAAAGGNASAAARAGVVAQP